MKTMDMEEVLEELAEAQEEARVLRDTLENTADALIRMGLIDTNPHARRLFIDGMREL